MIYLDNAATSYPKPESVLRAVERTMRFLIGFYIAREQGGSLQVSPAPL